MPIKRAPSGRRPRAVFLVGLLLLTLALAGVLAYEAQDAARGHRAAVEGTLEDYAAFAVWEFGRQIGGQVGVSVHQTLHPLFEEGSHTVVRPELPGLAEFEQLLDPETAACGVLESIDYYFRLDLRDGSLEANGLPPLAGETVWLADTLAAEAAALERRSAPYEGLLFGGPADRGRAVGFAVTRDAAQEPAAVHGFVTDAAAFALACDFVFPAWPLLPPSLTGGAPTDSLVSVLVTSPGGQVICGSAVQYHTAFAAVDTLRSREGRLIVQAALRPEAAETLLIGGLPRSRLPLLLGLLLLTAGLVVVALVQLRREYELARLRDEFVSGVSHELRTPLAQIRMFVETLLLGRVRSDVERRRSLEIIERESRRLGQLVENVLQFSRSERGGGRIAPEPTALGALVGDVVESFRPLARARGVELRTAVEEGVAAAVDRGAVRQMLLNLLDNAVKYGPRGQTVTVGVAAAARGGVLLHVDDEGPGVPVADRQRVWDSFNRLERDVEAAVAGSGIGLAVVRELASLHGGRCRIEDAPGGGARFVIELPVAGQRDVACEAGSPASAATGPDPARAAGAAGRTAGRNGPSASAAPVEDAEPGRREVVA